MNKAKAAAALKKLQAQLADTQRLVQMSQYDAVRTQFDQQLRSSVRGYLSGDLTRRQAISRATQVVQQQYRNVGGIFGADPALTARIDKEITDEVDYIEGLFGDLSLQRKAGDKSLPQDRLEQYGRSLDAVFNEASASAKRKQKVFWRRGDTEQGCMDCLRLDGQLHAMQYYLDRGFIPRKAGAKMKCGGYKCDCRWEDENGNPISIDEG